MQETLEQVQRERDALRVRLEFELDINKRYRARIAGEEVVPRHRDRPSIVCLCGSTRFREQFAQLNRLFTRDGWIVLAPGVFGHDGDEITELEKLNLDRLHLAKIRMADVVYVMNVGGYIGESTSKEIAFAKELGTPIVFYESKDRESTCYHS